MNNSKRRLSKSALGVLLANFAGAHSIRGGDFEITKYLWGASGRASTANANFHLDYSLGESFAANSAAQSGWAVLSGYSVDVIQSGAAGASAVFAYPNPWRPHGPKAGEGPGQTGTEAGGIAFSNLPSECVIKIYTLAGVLVREIQRAAPQGSLAPETWDVKNAQGMGVVSGIYLWTVESAQGSKQGKLLVIR